jgi:hypothetical protein
MNPYRGTVDRSRIEEWGKGSQSIARLFQVSRPISGIEKKGDEGMRGGGERGNIDL